MMGDRARGAFAKRGAVYLVHQFEFPDKTKAKFCVLLEDYREGAVALYVALTTHRMEHLRYPTAVLIPAGTLSDIEGDSVLQCENLWEIRAGDLLGRKTKYLGQLSQELLAMIDEALESLDVPENVFIRITGLDP